MPLERYYLERMRNLSILSQNHKKRHYSLKIKPNARYKNDTKINSNYIRTTTMPNWRFKSLFQRFGKFLLACIVNILEFASNRRFNLHFNSPLQE